MGDGWGQCQERRERKREGVKWKGKELERRGMEEGVNKDKRSRKKME